MPGSAAQRRLRIASEGRSLHPLDLEHASHAVDVHAIAPHRAALDARAVPFDGLQPQLFRRLFRLMPYLAVGQLENAEAACVARGDDLDVDLANAFHRWRR